MNHPWACRRRRRRHIHHQSIPVIAMVVAIMAMKVVGQPNDIFGRQSSSGSYSVRSNDATQLQPTQPPPFIDTSDLARIVGGYTVNPTLYPFYTFIEIETLQPDQTAETSLCGGSLVAPDIVLTAAHCLLGSISKITARVNYTSTGASPDTTEYQYVRLVSMFRQHPGYVEDTFTNDVAVLLLAEPVNEVVPIVLNQDPNVPNDGATVQVIGVGKIVEDGPFPDYLQGVDLQIVDSETCATDYLYTLALDADSQLCAAAPGKDSCTGDSGGPLLVSLADGLSYTQIGTVSFGKGCAQEVCIFIEISWNFRKPRL